MQTPVFSIVVPVYKAEKWLHRCVNSVLCQTFSDFELILVNDGSPDSSGQLCDAFAAADSRVRVLHKQNGGVSSARNAGIQLAKGHFLCFIDADDSVSAFLLQSIFDAANRHPGDFIFWHYTREHQHLMNQPFAAPTEHFAPGDIALLYVNGLLGAVWPLLFECKLLKQSGLLFDESLEMGEDLVFVFQYAHILFEQRPTNKFCFLRAPLYFYDNDDKADSLSRRLPDTFCHCWIQVFEAVLFECRTFFKVNEQNEYAILHNYMRTLGAGITALLENGKVPHRQRRKKARAVLNEPAVKALVAAFGQRQFYSPFLWPFRLKSPWAIRFLAKGENGRYMRFYWLGYAIHQRLHKNSPSV